MDDNEGKERVGRQAEVHRNPTRPNALSPNLKSEILHRLASGETLKAICQPEEMPSHVTVLHQVLNDPDFQGGYERAREVRVEVLLDEIRQIADHGHNDWMAQNDPNNAGYRVNGESVERTRLRIELRKWLVETLAPGKYGPDAEPETEEMMPAGPFKQMMRNIIATAKPLPICPQDLSSR